MTKIDKDVPPPGKRRFPVEHPWSFVERGDSFLLPLPKDRDATHRFKMLIYKKAERRWGKGNYRTRQEMVGRKKHVRIWRLK